MVTAEDQRYHRHQGPNIRYLVVIPLTSGGIDTSAISITGEGSGVHKLRYLLHVCFVRFSSLLRRHPWKAVERVTLVFGSSHHEASLVTKPG